LEQFTVFLRPSRFVEGQRFRAGKTDDGRTIGDNSALLLDVVANGKATAKVDRDYLLNPWPEMPGMYCDISLGADSSTPIMDHTAGRGAIRYLQTPEGKIVRVDVFVIPLAEISKHVSDKIRLCYYGSSPVPPIKVNSGGYERPGGELLRPQHSLHELSAICVHHWRRIQPRQRAGWPP
jgi:hypothetical protein